MQIWKTYHEDEIAQALMTLSNYKKIQPAIVVTTISGEIICAEKYDAEATHGKGSVINAFLRIGKIFCNGDDLFYELEHTQLYPNDIKEIAACDNWVAENESPEKALRPGMRVRITRNDNDTVYTGELTEVTFLDIVVKTDSGEESIPSAKIRSVIIL